MVLGGFFVFRGLQLARYAHANPKVMQTALLLAAAWKPQHRGQRQEQNLDLKLVHRSIG
jgi:hypothetical protein